MGYARTRRMGVLGIVLGLSALVSTAQGQGGATGVRQDVDTDEARGAFQAGEAAYRAGRFPEALRYFERAYELTQEPDVLYNVATVHERLRHDREALDAYRQYLEARPESQDRANIEARIALLEEAVRGPGDHTDTPDDADESAEPQEADSRPVEPDNQSDARGPQSSAPNTSSGPGPVPWVLLASGGVALAVGVVLLALGQMDADTVANGRCCCRTSSTEIEA